MLLCLFQRKGGFFYSYAHHSSYYLEKVLNFTSRLEKSFLEFGLGPWKVLDFFTGFWKVLEIHNLMYPRHLLVRGQPESRGFSLALLLAWFPVTKLTTRQTSHANDFSNAKSHARDRETFANRVVKRLKLPLLELSRETRHIKVFWWKNAKIL